MSPRNTSSHRGRSTPWALPLLLLASSLLLPAVSAHGWVGSIVIDDSKTYKGAAIHGDAGPGDGVIRKVADETPVTDFTSKDVACGRGDPGPVKNFASAKPGSSIAVHWMNGNGEEGWPHEVGPIITYLASCASDDCQATSGSSYTFFKIAQDGLDTATGKWKQGETVYEGKAPYTFVLPEGLPGGKYLVRHEIIALHNGAELYPSCFNLDVDGPSGDVLAKVPADDLVKFPGAYKAGDPSLKTWSYKPSDGYVFPGPAISKNLAAAAPGGGDGGGGGGESSSSSSSTAALPTTTETASTTASDTSALPSTTTSAPNNPGDSPSTTTPPPSSTPSDTPTTTMTGHYTTLVTMVPLTVVLPVDPSAPAGDVPPGNGTSTATSAPPASSSSALPPSTTSSGTDAPTATPSSPAERNFLPPGGGGGGLGLVRPAGSGSKRRDVHRVVVKRRAARWSV